LFTENPYFFKVYKETQPVPIFDYSQEEEEETGKEPESKKPKH
jgi:hypothetical protein